MGALTLGTADHADFLAGVNPSAAGDPTITRRADSTADFLTATIKLVTIKPAKGVITHVSPSATSLPPVSEPS